MTDDWGISCKIALSWMPLDLTDDKSTLVQVTAWCRQATSHYLSQCWPRSLSPYGVTRPQWVNQSPLVPHICISELGQHWFRWWLGSDGDCLASSHYLNQSWVIVKWTLRNKLQWNFNQNIKPFFHKSASENIICKVAPILSRARGVNSLRLSDAHMHR